MFLLQNHPFQDFLVSKTYFYKWRKKNYIFAHVSVKAQRGGGVFLRALADMSAKNVSFFGRLPFTSAELFEELNKKL